MQRATTQLPGDPDADLLGDLRRLFAASDPVAEHLLAAARLALGAQPIDVLRPRLIPRRRRPLPGCLRDRQSGA